MESDHKLYFVHYHLDEDQYFIPIDKEPTPIKLDDTYSATDYDLVSFGHHHIIHNFKSDARAYFNPGSLGCYHKPFARYGIIRVSNEGIREELMEIPYNNREFLRSYEQLKVPDREFILKVFHGGQV
ncbi:Calcineurin-like phosphoesterase superfamily domain protein [compost metagenome]